MFCCNNRAQSPKVGETSYTIEISTGDRFEAGTDAKVQIQLFGDTAISEIITPNHTFSNDFERNGKSTFQHIFPTLGDIWVVKVWQDGAGVAPGWYLNEIVISYDDQNRLVFPARVWVTKNKPCTLYHTTATKVTSKNLNVRGEMDLQVALGKTLYEWNDRADELPGLVPKIKNLPEREKFDLRHQLHVGETALLAIVNGIGAKIENLFNRWDTLSDYSEAYSLDSFMPEPVVSDDWTTDEEFGRQRVQGMHPFGIVKVTSALGESFPVTDDLLGDLLEGFTLEEAISNNKIYICNYGDYLKDTPVQKGYALACPQALFYCNKSGNLLPLAIQLLKGQGPIYTPKDGKYTWLLARTYFQNAEFIRHQNQWHQSYTHNVEEAFCISANRNLSSNHPIYRLLSPHWEFLLAINEVTRENASGGPIEEVASAAIEGQLFLQARANQDYDFTQTSFKNELNARGVNNAEDLPYYPYRDDGIILWDLFSKYTEGILKLFYKSDKDVTEDEQLVAWMTELRDTCKLKGLPGKDSIPQTFEDVHFLATTLLWNVTALHSVCNYSQWSYTGFVPNCPTGVHEPVPTEKFEAEEKDVVKMLPTKNKSIIQVGLARLICTTPEINMLQYRNYYFESSSGKELKIVKDFIKGLEQAEATIVERQKDRKVPYHNLNPSKISFRISQ